MLKKMLLKLMPAATPFDQWCSEYEKLIDLRNLNEKTKDKKKLY